MAGHVGPALLRAVHEIDPPGPSAPPDRARRNRAIAKTLKDLSGK
jgi:hypothetical protein